jgi:uncharacterized YccA/Bax inhibitor family protein
VPSNPVVNRFGSGQVQDNRATTYPQPPTPGELRDMYNQPAYGGPTYPPTTGGGGGGGGGWGAAPARYMTLDDVVVRTGAMLAVLFAAGAVSWAMLTTTAALPLILLGLFGGLGLGLYMSFTGRANAVTALLYSAFEGLFLGAISRVYNDQFHGIVIQALTGTVLVAGAMLFVYRIGAIRVTPRFTRMVVGATLGAVGLMLVNLIASIFVPGGLGLRSGGALAILISIVFIAIAAFNLVLDFDMIEQGIKRGADQKFAWYASFGLMLTLVWLYLEILRLLSYFMGGRNN